MHRDAQRLCGTIDLAHPQRHREVISVPQHCHVRGDRDELLQQLEAIAAQFRGLIAETGDVAARS
jgi:hypothetical protein